MKYIMYNIQRKLFGGVRVVVRPGRTYFWKEDCVIRTYTPDQERAIYIAPDDPVLCEQRQKKAVVYLVRNGKLYPFMRLKDCLDIWL